MMPYIPPMQQKTETRKGGFFEDVLRYWQQTFSHGAMRFVELVLILASVYFWARVSADYMDSPDPTGRAVEMLGYALWGVTLIIIGYVTIRVLWSDRVSDDRTTRAVVTIVGVGGWLAFNYFASPVIVFALVTIQVNIVYVVPFAVIIAAIAFVPSAEMGRYGFNQEVTRQTAFNSEGYWLEELKQNFEREKRDLNADLQAALDEIDGLKARVAHLTSENADLKAHPVKEFAPYNHGSAKSLPIGARSFMPDEQARLARWIGAWPTRGTARDNWTTRKSEQQHGWRIGEPEWDKFVDALKGLGYLDDTNKPLLSPDEVLKRLRLPPYPTSGSVGSGGNGAKPDPTRPEAAAAGGQA